MPSPLKPWFEDGNIVLLTQEDPTAFRVHRGVLSRHSEVFNDMFGLPQAAVPDTELFEGCQVVWMYDRPLDLSNLVKVIYDGHDFANDSAEAFFKLCGVLRLATKYFIGQTRRQAIQSLLKVWPSTLKGHDEMVEAALTSPLVDDLSYPYIHPLHALNLAREVDVNIIVPSALYFLSSYPLSGILRADHPKLLLAHPSKPSSTIASSDVLIVLHSALISNNLLPGRNMRQRILASCITIAPIVDAKDWTLAFYTSGHPKGISGLYDLRNLS
ncbi:hypothetical protein CVT26_016040 [Gymnopilus dilepis]|uniref:BTB domain-containing protein n=1 Tax=Gymnopilus dilepis TaxID=231916 RepID=A0A409YDN7_9AGAR|nr:hypothetical protein CVT26_016040 [Gymnopilus dilepis]